MVWNLDFEITNLEMVTGEKPVTTCLKEILFLYMLYDKQEAAMKCAIPTSGMKHQLTGIFR